MVSVYITSLSIIYGICFNAASLGGKGGMKSDLMSMLYHISKYLKIALCAVSVNTWKLKLTL